METQLRMEKMKNDLHGSKTESGERHCVCFVLPSTDHLCNVKKKVNCKICRHAYVSSDEASGAKSLLSHVFSRNLPV